MRISSFKFRKKFRDGALLTSPMQTKYCHRNSSKKSIDCKFFYVLFYKNGTKTSKLRKKTSQYSSP